MKVVGKMEIEKIRKILKLGNNSKIKILDEAPSGNYIYAKIDNDYYSLVNENEKWKIRKV